MGDLHARECVFQGVTVPRLNNTFEHPTPPLPRPRSSDSASGDSTGTVDTRDTRATGATPGTTGVVIGAVGPGRGALSGEDSSLHLTETRGGTRATVGRGARTGRESRGPRRSRRWSLGPSSPPFLCPGFKGLFPSDRDSDRLLSPYHSVVPIRPVRPDSPLWTDLGVRWRWTRMADGTSGGAVSRRGTGRDGGLLGTRLGTES